MKEAYYIRVMSKELEEEVKGNYKWLICYVRDCKDKDLEFQTGEDRFSVYRGTGCILQLEMVKEVLKPDAAIKYKKLKPDFYKAPTEDGLIALLGELKKDPKLNRYYINSKKEEYNEGYYQTLFGRRYTLHCKENDDFILFDKEFQIGGDEYSDEIIEWAKQIIDVLKREFKSEGIKLPKDIRNNYTECDYAGINKKGDLCLFEVKQYKNTSGIYESPLQIGFYDKLVCKFKEEHIKELENTIFNMLAQKEGLGMIKKTAWIPKSLSGNIKLYVVIGGLKKDTKKEVKASKTAIKGFKITRELVGKDITYCSLDSDGTLIEEDI